MSKKLKLAVNWAAACGGCDVALLDTEERLLALAAIADIVYWPVATDFKREDLLRAEPQSIDVGIFNGAIRTEEHEEDARIMREKCRVLIAFGACAAFGGIPGLGNLSSRDDLLQRAYVDTPSTENPDASLPQTTSQVDGETLELPGICPNVKCLADVVPVDLWVPGCPPTPEVIDDLLDVVDAMAAGKPLPSLPAVLAPDVPMCQSCDRVQTRSGKRIHEFKRPHEILADPEICLLEQGILCMGFATRDGCGHRCLKVNMPCRGCFGPLSSMLDPAAEALSALGSMAGTDAEDEQVASKRLSAMRSLQDLAGTLYRFTLPSSTLKRTFSQPNSNKVN